MKKTIEEILININKWNADNKNEDGNGGDDVESGGGDVESGGGDVESGGDFESGGDVESGGGDVENGGGGEFVGGLCLSMQRMLA